MKILINSCKWSNGSCVGDRDIVIEQHGSGSMMDELVFKDTKTGEEVLRFHREELCKAIRGFDDGLVIRLEGSK